MGAVAIVLLFLAVWLLIGVQAMCQDRRPRHESDDPATLAALMHDRLTRIEGTGSVDMTADSDLPTEVDQ